MPEALTFTQTSAPAVTADQLELVRKTIAQGATPDELKLFLYDCARQHVHPLDKLIHFTKREGRYTPITSIDFMRIRAAETGEYAGSDDPLFTGPEGAPGFAATVCVWRIVQGQRYPFTATARWTEYKPAANDFMWKKMPHTMLGKCAEALALRKGFPKQLSGLYAKEELDQAEATAPAKHTPITVTQIDATTPPTPPRGVTQTLPGADLPEAWQPLGHDPNRFTGRIVDVRQETKKAAKTGRDFTKSTITLDSGEEVTTLNTDVAQTAKDCVEDGSTVEITTKDTRWGKDIVTLARIPDAEDDDVAL